jgi:RNA polymerase sigma-70 factor (ECF subfamily)
MPLGYGCNLTLRGYQTAAPGLYIFRGVEPAVPDPKPSLIERLYAEHRAALHSFFRRRIRNQAHAADLAQEVYLRMLRVPDPSSIRNPAVYLFTVASNLAKEQATLDQRQAGVDLDEAPLEEASTPLSLDGELDLKQRVDRLERVLGQLSPKCRAAVVLRFRHDLSYRQIAAHIGISTQMAKKYVARGLEQCQRRLAGLG